MGWRQQRDEPHHQHQLEFWPRPQHSAFNCIAESSVDLRGALDILRQANSEPARHPTQTHAGGSTKLATLPPREVEEGHPAPLPPLLKAFRKKPATVVGWLPKLNLPPTTTPVSRGPQTQHPSTGRAAQHNLSLCVVCATPSPGGGRYCHAGECTCRPDHAAA